ncbi:MAG: fimbria major subunit [Muribaculaceae bacterium]|nr:fimbria major subunit [Muribaculaceae bacterium]
MERKKERILFLKMKLYNIIKYISATFKPSNFGRVGGCIGLGSLLCLLILSSCINESFDECNNRDGNYDSEVNYYIALDIVPASDTTRGTTEDEGTSTDGTNNGVVKEQSVETAAIYFFNVIGGDYVCHFTTSNSPNALMSAEVANTTKNYTLTQKMEISDIRKILGKKLNVYVLTNLSTYPNVSANSTEENFLNNTFNTSFGEGFSQVFGTTGIACPMGNIEKCELDLTQFAPDSENPTDGEIYALANTLFTASYTGTGYKAGDKLYKITGSLKIEKMIARIDYKCGNTISFTDGNESVDVNNLYVMSGHTASVENCNASTGGAYLKLRNITIFNASKEAYLFRHTAKGDNTGATYNDGYTIEPFDNENHALANGEYTWVADCNWNKTNSFFNAPTIGDETWSLTTEDPDASKSADDIIKTTVTGYDNDGFSPWYYVMENTVPSTDLMTLSNCTGLEFELVLWDPTTSSPYEGVSDEDVRITRNSDSYYQKLEYVSTGSDGKGYFRLIYKYLIPHNSTVNSTTGGTNTGATDVNGKDGQVTNGQQTDGQGTDGQVTSRNPMHYAIVRNNIYQISLLGIKNLPDPRQPDNMILQVSVNIADWDVRKDENVTLF